MNLTAETMTRALKLLNKKIANAKAKPIRLIVGGGGAMLLAHQYPLATADIDAIPAAGTRLDELDVWVKEIARELKIPGDWLNPYFSTFTHVLPEEYPSRLVEILNLSHLQADALSKEDLLIMKCFAGRRKDLTHSRALVEKGANTRIVEKHLETLLEKSIPKAQEAIDFLDEVLDTE